MFPNKIYKNILLLLSNLFKMGINFLILDKDFNFNYLPFNADILNKYDVYKTLKHFNVKVIIFLDLKPRMVKKYLNFNLLNISFTNNINIKYMDFFSKHKNLKIFHYIIYIYLLNLYLTR
jgi:hypothetical protein